MEKNDFRLWAMNLHRDCNDLLIDLEKGLPKETFADLYEHMRLSQGLDLENFRKTLRAFSNAFIEIAEGRDQC